MSPRNSQTLSETLSQPSPNTRNNGVQEEAVDTGVWQVATPNEGQNGKDSFFWGRDVTAGCLCVVLFGLA